MKIASWRKVRFRFDWTLTMSALLVVALGLLNLWSAVHDRQSHLFTHQISWLALGMLIFVGIATLDYRLISRLSYVFYGVGLALLVGVLAFGKMVGGGRRWFDLGSFHVQPSELMQVLTVLALGKYFNDSPALEGRSWRHLAMPVLIVSFPAMLIAKQPDFGTAFLILAIFFTIMLTARLKLKTLAAIAGMAVIAAFPIYQHLLHEYQRKRVEAFFNPTSEGAYQTRQALNAIGSGRFLGKGFMQGTQIRLRKFPALETDFPFAVWAEEWGFIGCFVVLVAYSFLILWVIKIASEARDRFGATVCVGVAAMLFWHVAINVGMVSGLIPVVGVTLPLISYGGSSLLTTMVALGVVMNVSVRRYSY
ncbi:MAG TPA: rod shape-determining protein RodA [Polyangia bacterium]|nr:rod shape-determining protein RodA [Polyangia bacterium]